MNTSLKLVYNNYPEHSGKKDYINKLIEDEPKKGVLFSDFIYDTVLRKSKRMGKSYSLNYKTLIYHLNKFSEEYEAIIFTNSVGEEFMDDFITYLENKNLKQGYIATLISLVKSMTNKAARYGYAVDPSYDDVNVEMEETFSVYLSMNEITRIYYYENLTKKQRQIKDLFVVGCLTALRYSDYSTLTKENFNGNFITKITKKTNTKVIIPIHEYVKEIYLRYNENIPGGLAIQHFNRYMKLICKKVGINEKVSYSYIRGGKLVTETKEKWELISSHTARRSAATNMYMTGRMKTYEIMSLTGHTTEKSFFRYIKTTNEDKVNSIAGDSFFRI
jgi:integrase